MEVASVSIQSIKVSAGKSLLLIKIIATTLIYILLYFLSENAKVSESVAMAGGGIHARTVGDHVSVNICCSRIGV